MAWVPLIDKRQAIARAKALAAEKGWAWVEPARTTLRSRWFGPGRRWEIWSNANGLGAIVRVVLDADTGEILESGYIPR